MIDAHVHLQAGDPRPLTDRLLAFGAGSLCALGVPCLWGVENNIRCLGLKRLMPGKAWAFGGLVWNREGCPIPEMQLELLTQAGFDGLKLIETKPTLQRRLGFLPDAEAFDPLFALAEKHAIPIVWHVGDPATFWHKDLAPAFAVENGWTYDGPDFMPLEDIYRHTEAVLKRHPKLTIVFAHLYFCSEDRQRLETLFAQYLNVCVDIAPGSEMYRGFAADPPGWESFFRKHASRVLLGTDMTNAEPDSAWRELSALTRGILRPAPFKVWDIEMKGFDLNEAQRELITGGNFIRLAGQTPLKISAEGLRKLLSFYREHLDKDEYTASQAACEELLA